MKKAATRSRVPRRPRGHDAAAPRQEDGEARFRSLIENTGDVILIIDAGGILRYESPSTERVLGYRRERFTGDDIFRFIHPDDAARVRDAFAALVQTPGRAHPVGCRVRHKDGSWRDFEGVATNLLDDPHVRGVVVNARDVTERRRTEEALRAAEARFRTLVEQIPAITYVAALDGLASTLFISPQIESLGYSADEWLADPALWSTRIHPDDRERVLAEYARAFAGGEPFRCEYRLLTRDGRVRWFRDEASPVRDDAGRPLCQQGVMVDITERKRTEQALEESQRRFALFMEHLPGVAFVKDANGRYLFINRVGESTLGVEPGAWLGRTDLDLLPRPVAQQLRANDALARSGGHSSVVTEELRDRTWLVSKFLIPDAGGEPALLGGVAIDATDRVEAEARLREYADRLQALSRRLIDERERERRHLARELHDQVGQELTGLGLMLDACLRDGPERTEDRLRDALGLVNELIGRVRTLSLMLRPAVLDDLGLLPALAWHFERYTMQTGVRVLFSQRGLDRRLPAEVETAAYRIVQEALTNVARHAGVREVAVHVGVDGGRLRLAVEDAGAGFAAGDAPATPAGSGLIGMRERASAVGGGVTITSAPGTGTRLIAELPVRGDGGSA